MDMPERFTAAYIQAILQRDKGIRYPSTPRRPPIAFLPEGDHEVGFFPDPTGTWMRKICIHCKGTRQTHCPNYAKLFGPPADYPTCGICTRQKETGLWNLRPERVTMVYGYLSTTTTSWLERYWEPGRPYVIIGDARLAQALEAMLESLRYKHPGLLSTLFRPQEPGPVTHMNVKKGKHSAVTMTLQLDACRPAIPLGPWYKPLEQVWLAPTFSQTDYNAVYAAVTRDSGT